MTASAAAKVKTITCFPAGMAVVQYAALAPSFESAASADPN